MLIQSVLAVTEGSNLAQNVLQGLRAQAGGQGSSLSVFAMVAVVIVIYYVFLIRPQSKQAKEHNAMLSALKKGDGVVLGGGITGRVHQVGEKLIVVEVAQGVRLRVIRTSITGKVAEGLLGEDVETKSDAKSDKSEKEKEKEK